MERLSEKQEQTLHIVHAIADEIQRGNQPRAEQLLDELTRLRESQLFQEMGRVTRELHEALNGFHSEAELAELAGNHISDAKERLDFVISKTEESAHKTLSAIEQTVPISEGLVQRAKALKDDWTRFERRELSVGEFRALAHELMEFFDSIQMDAEHINNNLTNVLMAQDFQDLTGQVIRRVIQLVQEVEESLVGLIRMRGRGRRAVEQAPDNGSRGEGPQIGGNGAGNVVSNQDEVDDLLSSLGF